MSTTSMGGSSAFNSHDTSKSDLKVEHYDGDKYKLGMFLVQLKAVFKLQPGKYTNHADRVMYAGLHMRKSAFNWFEPIMTDQLTSHPDQRDDDTKEIFSNFSIFEDKLKMIFGIPGEEQAAAQQIHRIKQTGSAAQYYASFQRIASKLDWDPPAFAAAYYTGLKDIVKDKMGSERPVDYKPLVDKSIEIDNWLYERKMERDGNFRGYSGTYRNKSQYHYGDPMDTSAAMQDGRASRPKGPRKGAGGPRRGSQEKDRRRRENLCYTCGKPGHRARECNLAQGLHMMSDGIAGMEETKADTSMKTQMVADDQGKTAQKGHQGSDAQGVGEPGEGVLQQDEKPFEELEGFPMLSKRIRESMEAEKDGASPPGTTIALKEACRRITETPISYAAQFNYSNAGTGHALLSWTACYDDSCTIHYSDKMGAGWFPHEKRPRNRRNKKSKELQEVLAREGDLREQPGFWMMTDGRPEPTPEEPEKPKFIAISMTREKIVIITPHWRTVPRWKKDCKWTFEHAHRNFDPKQRAMEPYMVEIELCQDDDCSIPGIHGHQGNDREIVPMETPPGVEEQLRASEEINALSMMNDQKDPNDVEIPLGPREDTNEEPTFVFNVGTTRCVLATTQWIQQLCRDKGCDVMSQHTHIVYDSEAEPRTQVKRIRMEFCQDEECEDKESLHAHQRGVNQTVEIQVAPSKEKKIRESWKGDSMMMMVDNLAALGPVVDERYDREMIGEKFWCTNNQCPRYQTVHSHLFNVDPNFPQFPIETAVCEEMIADGMLCEQQECQWRKNLHVHFSQNNFSMMVGDKYNPEIIENIVDHRVDDEYVADYFGCEEKCERIDAHSHIYHIDPRQPHLAILPQQFARLNRCTEMQCTWTDYEHVHLPKN